MKKEIKKTELSEKDLNQVIGGIDNYNDPYPLPQYIFAQNETSLEDVGNLGGNIVLQEVTSSSNSLEASLSHDESSPSLQPKLDSYVKKINP